MNPTEQAMLHLLDCALNGKTPDISRLEGANWEDMFMLAQQHKMDALLLDTLCMLPEACQPPPDVLTAWQNNAMLTVMGQAFIVEQLFSLLRSFDAANLRVVVLKGVVLKALYKDPDLRTMSDADLLVSEKDFDAACVHMRAQNYTVVEEEPGVCVFRGEDGLRVELHQRLFDKTAYGFLSRLNESSMFPIDGAVRCPVYGGDAWVLPPMQHALFMLCHMAKHMITTGFGLRQTVDLALFVKANDTVMDWDAFWHQADVLGLYGFASALLELAVIYFSLPKGIWAKGAKSDPPAAEALLLDLLDAGVFGNRTEERQRSAAVVYRSFDAQDGDSGKLRRALFPSATSLKAPYLYARAHRALLPVAWGHRLLRYLWQLITGKAKRSEITMGMRIADERLLLLGRLGLKDQAIQAGGEVDDTGK